MAKSLMRPPFHRHGFIAPQPERDLQLTYQSTAVGTSVEQAGWGTVHGWAPRDEFLIAVAQQNQPGSNRARLLPRWQVLSPKLSGGLQNLRLLPAGWDGEDALAIEPEAIARAERILEKLASTYLNFKEPVVVPKYDGNLQIEWHSAERTLELEGTSGPWSVMGALRQNGDSIYLSGEMELQDWPLAEEYYLWWVERRLIWPSKLK